MYLLTPRRPPTAHQKWNSTESSTWCLHAGRTSEGGSPGL